MDTEPSLKFAIRPAAHSPSPETPTGQTERPTKKREGTVIMGTGVSLKPIEVLIVEDEPGDILVIKQALSREPVPISIRVAVDGHQAASILEREEFKPDLVILDLNLPKLSGLGFLQGYRPDAPVIVFTSSSNPHDCERALTLGAKEYIVKPSDLNEYTRLVSGIVHKWARSDNTIDHASGA